MRSKTYKRVVGCTALAVGVAVAYFGWPYIAPGGEITAVPERVVSGPPASAAQAQAQAQAPTAAAPEPGIQNPIEAVGAAEVAEADATDEAAQGAVSPSAAALPTLADANTYVTKQLSSLLNRRQLLAYVQLDGFLRRAVATVDNLPRAQAPSAAWPFNPTPQRFITRADTPGSANGSTIAPSNSQRYAPWVAMVESVDSARAVALYRRLYPLFQQTYVELGFPNGYFNDRLVQVLDHLIATPVHSEPLRVTLVEVKGTTPSLRPWVRYEFVEPALQGLSSGQKMLLRMGPENHTRLIGKLKDIRQRVAKR